MGLDVLQAGVPELQHLQERGPLTQVTHRAVGLLELRHWVDACQDLEKEQEVDSVYGRPGSGGGRTAMG